MRVQNANLQQACLAVEKNTDLTFVVGADVLADDTISSAVQSFYFVTKLQAINAIQYSYNVNAAVNGNNVYLSKKAPELVPDFTTIELCFLSINTTKSLDLGAELSFLPADLLTTKINDLIDLYLEGKLKASRGWTVSKREISCTQGQVCTISNATTNYVERSSISDYGTRTVNGYDERNAGDILEIELVGHVGGSALCKITLEESSFLSTTEKKEIKSEVFSALDDKWRIVADYFHAKKLDEVGFFDVLKQNDKIHFLVLARTVDRYHVDDFLKVKKPVDDREKR